MHSAADEERSFKLLADVRTQLADALDSLEGIQSRGLLDNYNFHASKYVNRAAEGYMFLRQSRRSEASKLLVRPTIEVMFRLLALRRKPDLLYRIAYSERLEDRKWLEPAAANSGQRYDAAEEDRRWKEFSAKYAAQFPDQSVVALKLTIQDAAEAAGLKGYYNSHYRTYCQHTHAAMRAMGDFLSDLTDAEDNRTMALCVFVSIESVVSVGASAPELASLQKRLNDLSDPNQS